jgi:hypothetical protein
MFTHILEETKAFLKLIGIIAVTIFVLVSLLFHSSAPHVRVVSKTTHCVWCLTRNGG